MFTRQNNQESAWHEACQTYLSLVFEQVKASKDYSIDEALSAMHQEVALTYGEILYEGLLQLLKVVPLKKEDVFVDCGSGLGKLLLQVLLNTPVGHIIGVEIDATLASLSRRAAQLVRTQCPDLFNKRKLEVIQGSFFDNHFPPATVMFACCLCFAEDTMEELGEWMNAHPELHTVISYKPIPTLQCCQFEQTLVTECTWDAALCYLYRR